MIDLVRVRQGREKLAILAEKYPELRGERSAANVKQWEKTLQTIGENEVEYAKNCKYILCGQPFTAARKDKDFCSDAHRTASHKLRDNEPSDLAKLMTRAVEFDAQFYGHPSNPDVKRARDTVLRDVHDAIARELGIVHETHVDEPENDASPDPLDADIVREKLRAYRDKTGSSQAEIAGKVDFSQGHVNQFVNGKINGSEFFLRRILDVVEGRR